MFGSLSSAAVRASLATLKQPQPTPSKPAPPTFSADTRCPDAESKKRKAMSELPQPFAIPSHRESGQGSDPASQWKLKPFQVEAIAWDEPATTATPDAIQHRRDEVKEKINQVLSMQNTSSTLRTYESLLKKEVGLAEDELQTSLLPLDSEQKFLALFGWLLTNEPLIKWTRVKALKAALTKYHSLNKQPCILGDWTQPMSAMWAGMSKMAVHSSSGKVAIPFKQVHEYLQQAGASPSMVRNRAMVAVSFFGVRRSAETRAFNLEHLSMSRDGCSLFVSCQKNDQAGLGMTCFIPHIESMGQCSPDMIIRAWISMRHQFVNDFENPKLPLFVTTTGPQGRIGSRVSADSFRKIVSAAFAGNTGTHSLRKGGATFYARSDAPEQITMMQGGWRTSEVLQTIYAKFTVAEQ